MHSLLIRNIKSLYGIRRNDERLVRGEAMRVLPEIADAFLLIENGRIHSYGETENAPERADEVIDATGRLVLPAWCDSHTHIVYAGSREAEFVGKINGLTYEEIAQRGGGILNSAALLNQTGEEELFDSAWQRLQEVRQLGTGAIEIKSGYGLSVEGEVKMLQVIRQLKEKSDLTIKATFLGAHAFPSEFKENRRGYIDLLIHQLLPQIAGDGLADYIDVFCEKGYFTVEETEEILTAGAKYGLRPKVHVNQFNIIDGVEASVKHNALSVDHLELVDENDIAALKNSDTMPVALPGCSFFLHIPYTPARRMISEGLPLALASDYNPGSCPSGNMNLVISLACINMQLTPEEAVNAATLNGAYAMGIDAELGSVTIGKKANLLITRPVPSLAYLPYSFGSNFIERAIVNR
jgi:imidazolonepropionase